MEMQLNKIIKTICFFCLFISCKNDAQNKNNAINGSTEQSSEINFFQRADENLYSMIVDESDISDHPILSYLNCKNEGYFTIHFIPKSDSLRGFWQKEFFTNYDFNNFDLEKDDKDIRQKLNNEYDEYNIFSFLIKKEYLSSNNGCTVESIYPKKGSKAAIYIYNQENKSWKFLKEVDTDFLPPYANTQYFMSNLSNLFQNKKTEIKEERRIEDDEKNVVFTLNANFDNDKKSEKIRVFKNMKSDDLYTQDHFSLPIKIYKGNILWKTNHNLILKDQNNCVSEGFGNIVVKNNYFTIESQSCYDYNVLVNTYTTFKVNGHEIYLQKYGESYFDKSNHEREIPSKVWTEKDFGKIKFENADINFLSELKNK